MERRVPIPRSCIRLFVDNQIRRLCRQIGVWVDENNVGLFDEWFSESTKTFLRRWHVCFIVVSISINKSKHNPHPSTRWCEKSWVKQVDFGGRSRAVIGRGQMVEAGVYESANRSSRTSLFLSIVYIKNQTLSSRM